MKPLPQRRRPASTRPTKKRSLQSYEGLLDGLPIGVILVSPDGDISAMNAEGARLCGGVAAAPIGASFPELWERLTGLSAGATKALLQGVHREKQPRQPAQVSIRQGRGPAIPVEWTCQPVSFDQHTGVSISLHDTSREQELTHDRNRLASIADESPYPILELDGQASLIYANPVMSALLTRFGYGPDGFPHVVPQGLPDLVRRCLDSNAPIQEIASRLPDACYAWVFCPVKTDRHVRGYAVDLTEAQRAKEALHASAEELIAQNLRLDRALQEAQAATKIKAAFLATVSHELRTPMNGVIGMTNLLLDTTLAPEQRSYAETIRQCGEALLQLINDVLECSKIEAGKLELESIDFNLRTTVEDVLKSFAERAEAKGLELTCLIHAAVPTGLRGDPGRLRQVLTNLLGNAIKFTEHGDVTLQVYLEEETEGDALLRFDVTDSGIGISEDTQRKLFQPFVQADSSMSRRYGGTGLGLSISKQLIELMGGQIGVKSAPERGSTFWCTARFPKQSSSVLAILPLADLQGHRVLIVDDNESNRLILHHLVSGWGMQDVLAEDAASALARIEDAAQRGTPFDCAIVDIVMPGKDGLQLAAELQRLPSAATLRIVVMTSLLQRGHAERARKVGAKGYLTKPVRHDELRDCLRTVLGMAPASAETPQADEAVPRLVTRHTLAELSTRRRVLVVEDNSVNQKLAVRMLEKLGYRPDLVENGQEALTALDAGGYDAVLMDCQMPIMDGFEATAAIRRQEAAGKRYSSAGHLPIIAVTANAMQGDRERCLASGMDAYLAKPIKLEDLRVTLARWIQSPASAESDKNAVQSAGPLSEGRAIFDPSQMLQNIGGDQDLLLQLVDLFLERQADMMSQIRQALSLGDAVTVERAAHTLKGTAGNLCAPEVVLAAGRLEAVGRLGTLHDAPAVYAHLEMEMLRLLRVLEEYRGRSGGLAQAAA
ncbi:hybrid sensor histidine kinase/response regulator [Nitrospira lenta]|uniref:histidine kinase n=1 Tax=Nitrospira lenta TaxID=1436998 RepID=A0A330L5Y4_9BACT|nr:response regulator [Nitrospira lenta]SPP65174.1 putative Hybrid histidine kinase [Nitrospira lenta]